MIQRINNEETVAAASLVASAALVKRAIHNHQIDRNQIAEIDTDHSGREEKEGVSKGHHHHHQTLASLLVIVTYTTLVVVVVDVEFICFSIHRHTRGLTDRHTHTRTVSGAQSVLLEVASVNSRGARDSDTFFPH